MSQHNETGSLVPTNNATFTPSVLEALSHNLSGENISLSELTRIKIPAGGATTWTIASPTGEEVLKHIDCVILAIGKRRAYWPSAVPGGRPMCYSNDLIHGSCVSESIGLTGYCATCKMNEWGSAPVGEGKACKEHRLLLILRPGRPLPEIVDVSPGSLKALKFYLLSLPVPYQRAITRLGLTKVRSKSGIEYAQLQLSYIGNLTEDESKLVHTLSKMLGDVFTTDEVGIDAP